MKHLSKRVFAGSLAAVMVCSMPAAVYANAAEVKKDENIYAVLNYDGQVDHLYAVNAFDMEEEGIITDYGDYDTVRNMTSTEEPEYQEGKVTVNAPQGRFYYQGNPLSKDLPWDIQIGYSFDGKSISPEELVGKSGAVEITILIGKNETIDTTYFDNFSLQISCGLDGDKFSQISAEGATIANAGNDKSLTFTHLPGKEKTYVIKANVTDFEMQPIQFAGVALSMDIEVDGVDDMTKDFSKLTDGIGDLKEGTDKLEEGSSDFNKGLNTLDNSTNQVKVSSGKIDAAISDSSKGLNTLIKSTKELKTLAKALLASPDPYTQSLAKGYLSQAKALEELSKGLSTLSDSYGKFDSGINKLTGGISSLANGYGKLDQGISSLSEGVEELNDETSGMDTKIEDKIDEMLADFTNQDYKPVSFLSDKNSSIDSVQFIIRTQALEHVEVVKVEEQEEKSLTFWDKLTQLFGM